MEECSFVWSMSLKKNGLHRLSTTISVKVNENLQISIFSGKFFKKFQQKFCYLFVYLFKIDNFLKKKKSNTKRGLMGKPNTIHATLVAVSFSHESDE